MDELALVTRASKVGGTPSASVSKAAGAPVACVTRVGDALVLVHRGHVALCQPTHIN
jgi:hypothetical protein